MLKPISTSPLSEISRVFLSPELPGVHKGNRHTLDLPPSMNISTWHRSMDVLTLRRHEHLDLTQINGNLDLIQAMNTLILRMAVYGNLDLTSSRNTLDVRQAADGHLDLTRGNGHLGGHRQ